MALNVIKQVLTAFCTAYSWKRIGSHRSGVALDDFHRLCRVDCYWHIGCPMSRLTVIAMAVELHDGFSSNSQFHGATTTRHLFGIHNISFLM